MTNIYTHHQRKDNLNPHHRQLHNRGILVVAAFEAVETISFPETRSIVAAKYSHAAAHPKHPAKGVRPVREVREGKVKAEGGKMGNNKVVALMLMVFAVAIRSQDLAALLAQGQAGGLNLAQVPWEILTLQWMRKINLMDLLVLLLIL